MYVKSTKQTKKGRPPADGVHFPGKLDTFAPRFDPRKMLIPDDKNVRGHLSLLAANLIFGLNGPIAKTVLAEPTMTPFALNMMRMAGAALLFWGVSLFGKWERVSPRDLLLLFFASLFSIQLNQTSFLIGLSMTSPIDASIVATLVPILTMVFAAMFLREPITVIKVLGVVVGATGALLLILNNGAVGRGDSHMGGNLICLIGATSYAIYLSVFRGLISRYSSITLMKWMFLFAAICATPLCWDDFTRVDFSGFDWDVYARIGYVVVGATFLAYMLIPIAQKHLRPTVVGMYNYLQPFVASLAAVALGQDAFGWAKGFAAGLVFLGVYIVIKSKSRAQLDAEQAARAAGEAVKPRILDRLRAR